jgi:hypothetical protein
MNKIFEEAVSRRFIKSSEVPKLETKGRKSDKFPTFEVEEINAIMANFPAWIARGTSEAKRQQRQMLFDYVRILMDTGARPGKELLDLQWKKIRVKITDRAEPKRVLDQDGQLQSIAYEEDEEGLLDEIFARDYYVFMSVSGKTNERTANGFEQTFKVLNEIVGRNYAGEKTSDSDQDPPDVPRIFGASPGFGVPGRPTFLGGSSHGQRWNRLAQRSSRLTVMSRKKEITSMTTAIAMAPG